MTQIRETPEGFHFVLNGVQHGTWTSKGAAKAGLATELARAKAREDAETEREMAYIDQRTQEYHEWRNRD